MTQRTWSLTQRLSSTTRVVGPISEAFDDIFRELRLKAVVYYAHEFCSPWGLRFEATENAQVHVVLNGSCQVVVGERTVHLGDQDALLLATGRAHIISDGSGRPARDAREVYRELSDRREPFLGTRPGACLLSGHFSFDRIAKQLLLPQLPDVLHMSAQADRGTKTRRILSGILADEIEARRPGSEIITERLAEVFLVQTIRDRLSGDSHRRNLLSAVLDPRLRAPIAVIHDCYHEPLTLQEIARRTGMSRSSLAGKFKALTTFSPMSYLAAWRMLRARELLANPTLSVGQIAAACGHRSAEGFSRAYKRVYGIAPSSARSDARVSA